MVQLQRPVWVTLCRILGLTFLLDYTGSRHCYKAQLKARTWVYSCPVPRAALYVLHSYWTIQASGQYCMASLGRPTWVYPSPLHRTSSTSKITWNSNFSDEPQTAHATAALLIIVLMAAFTGTAKRPCGVVDRKILRFPPEHADMIHSSGWQGGTLTFVRVA